MWFSVVYSFIDNDTRHHSGQNVVDSQGAAEWVCNKFWPLWWHVSLSIKLYTMLNHIRFVFYHNIKETKSLSWQLNTPTRIWKCTHCIMQMSCLYASDSFISQTRLRCRNNSKKCSGKELWRILVIDKSTLLPRKTTFRFIFYHNVNVKENFFFQSASWKRHCVTHWRE